MDSRQKLEIAITIGSYLALYIGLRIGARKDFRETRDLFRSMAKKLGEDDDDI